MIAELDRRIAELRFIGGVEKVEHVPYLGGDQFWVRFNGPFDLAKLGEIAKRLGYLVVGFGGLPSKLPRGLAEMLWSGVTHVVTKNMSGWSRLTSKFGFEPDGIAKLAMDLHGPYRIFMATSEEGIQLLYEYLGLNYVPPAPLPKPVASTPPKPAAPAAPRPAQPAAPPPTTPTPAPQKPTETKPAAPQQPPPANPASESSAK